MVDVVEASSAAAVTAAASEAAATAAAAHGVKRDLSFVCSRGL